MRVPKHLSKNSSQAFLLCFHCFYGTLFSSLCYVFVLSIRECSFSLAINLGNSLKDTIGLLWMIAHDFATIKLSLRTTLSSILLNIYWLWAPMIWRPILSLTIDFKQYKPSLLPFASKSLFYHYSLCLFHATKLRRRLHHFRSFVVAFLYLIRK